MRATLFLSSVVDERRAVFHRQRLTRAVLSFVFTFAFCLLPFAFLLLPSENPDDVGAELFEDDVGEQVACEQRREAVERGVRADAVVAGRAVLPEVGERAGRHHAREARVVRLKATVVVARDEDAARGVERAASEALARRRVVTRVLTQERRVEAGGEERLRAARREVACGARTPVGQLIRARFVRQSVLAQLRAAGCERAR